MARAIKAIQASLESVNPARDPKVREGAPRGIIPAYDSEQFSDPASEVIRDLSAYALQQLRGDAEFVLYRGRGDTDPRHILVLAPASEQPSHDTVKRIDHEFALRADLDPAWAVRPLALVRDKGRTVLVLEDRGGEPLDRLLVRPLELKSFLRVAIGLAAALSELHKRGIIHKDLKPANIMVAPGSDQAWLTGFGIASGLARERQTPEPPEIIAGTLAYMAPEQTGRMNRSIDSRSDLYSLGVTLYQMLTCELPFTASDPVEWVYCHIARQPSPPERRIKDVPAVLSTIVMKLLAKAPE